MIRLLIKSQLTAYGEIWKAHGDVPEVQAVISILGPYVEQRWADMTREMVNEVDRLSGDERHREDEIIAILASLIIEWDVSQLLNRVQVQEAASELFEAGQGSIGSLGPSSFDFITAVTALGDLTLQLQGHLRTQREAIESAVRMLVTSGAQERENAKETLSLAIEGGNWVAAVVDVWAYRWYNLGAFDAADRLVGQGFARRIIVVNNPPTGPDERTTPFCRSIHGKTIARVRIRRDIERFAAAVRRRDQLLAQDAWPFLTQAEAASVSTRPLSRLGLPPYHFRCRDVLAVA